MTDYPYMRALHQRFLQRPQSDHLQKDVDATRAILRDLLDREDLKHLLRLLDAEDTWRNQLSVESFAAGFKLAWGIAKELEASGLYAFDDDEAAIWNKEVHTDE